MARELKYRVWEEQVRGNSPDAKERGITRDSDWRNPDVLVKLDGGRVEVRDEAYRAHQGPSEPDWSRGWYVWVDNGGQTKILFESSGDANPPGWVRTAKMEGRVLYGTIILRDEQMHG